MLDRMLCWLQPTTCASNSITRQRSTADERNLVVTITEAGEALKEKAVAVPAEIAKCSNLEPEEAAMLYRILYKMLGKEHL